MIQIISFQLGFSTAEQQQTPSADIASGGVAEGVVLPAGHYRVICGELYRVEGMQSELEIVERAEQTAR